MCIYIYTSQKGTAFEPLGIGTALGPRVYAKDLLWAIWSRGGFVKGMKPMDVVVKSQLGRL